MGALFAFLVIGSLIGLVTGIIMLTDSSYRSRGFFILAGTILAIIVCVNIVSMESETIVNSTNIRTVYDKVLETTIHSLVLNDSGTISDFQGKSISEKYPLDFSNIKSGDIIKYQVIKGNFCDYIIKIEVITREEDE